VRYRNNTDGTIDGGVPLSPADEISGGGERYNWSLETEDTATSYGIKCTLPLFAKQLKLSACWDYTDNDGEADFSSAYLATSGTPLEDISAYGDYVLQTFKVTGEYTLRTTTRITLSYTYKDYDQDDIATNDYVYIFDGVDYFSGAYDNLDYHVSIYSLTVTYMF